MIRNPGDMSCTVLHVNIHVTKGIDLILSPCSVLAVDALTCMDLALHVEPLSVGILGGSDVYSWHVPTLACLTNGVDVRHQVSMGLRESLVEGLDVLIGVLCVFEEYKWIKTSY